MIIGIDGVLKVGTTTVALASDVNVHLGVREANYLSRASDIEATGVAGKTVSVEWEMLYKQSETYFTALWSAYNARTTVAIEALDNASKGITISAAHVVQFNINQPVSGPMTVSVVVKPAQGATVAFQTGS
jgi:hypothetical protein